MKKHDAQTKIVAAFGPVDLNTAAVAGDWVGLAMYDSCTTVVIMGDGTAGNDAAVRLRQATGAAGAGAKNLDGATWYETSHASALGESFAAVDGDTVTVDGEEVALLRCEVTADMLDVDNDYTHVQVTVTDPGAAKLAAGVHILRGARYAVKVPEQPTVLD